VLVVRILIPSLAGGGGDLVVVFRELKLVNLTYNRGGSEKLWPGQRPLLGGGIAEREEMGEGERRANRGMTS
jgi:hypothetical protein